MIYLDYNATTPLSEEARAAMQPYLEKFFGNASSVHAAGREARAAIDEARDQLASLLRVKPNELIFTSGGTESCNLAVLGLARKLAPEKKHLVSCKTEHHAVLNAIEHLQKHEGFEVSWLALSKDGLVEPAALDKALRPETALVSVMNANNETGLIQPLSDISQVCRARGVLLHSDLVQSFGKIEVDLALLDAASFAAHKFYGPKGAGLLFLRSGLALDPIMFGGAHENERRPGTENVAAIFGMAAAAQAVLPLMKPEQARQQKLRDQLWAGIRTAAPEAQQNAGNAVGLANTLNVSFPGIDSETMLMALDLEGVCASSGSACMVGSVVASHVLLALGLPVEAARSAVRFSLGKETTAEEIGQAVAALDRIMKRLSGRTAASETYAAV